MNLLLTGSYNYSDKQLEQLNKLGFNIIWLQNELEESNIDFSDITHVVCNNLFLYNDIKKFKSLKFVQTTTAGLDKIPVKYIKENNIKLFNAGKTYSIPMAEFAISKILEIYKNSKVFNNNQNNKIWEKNRNIYELNNKNALIIGYGNVGKEISKRLNAFNVNITASDIINNIDDNASNFINVNDVINQLNYFDIIILTLPLTSETKHFVNKEFLNNIKENSILINVARGAIINEKDLINTLKENKLLGVALDVFEEEPLNSNSLLWVINNVYITPHISYASDNINERLYQVIYNNLKDEVNK